MSAFIVHHCRWEGVGALLWDCMAAEMDFLGYLQGFFLQSGIVLTLLKKGSGNCDLELSAWHSSAESWGGWVLLCGRRELPAVWVF